MGKFLPMIAIVALCMAQTTTTSTVKIGKNTLTIKQDHEVDPAGEYDIRKARDLALLACSSHLQSANDHLEAEKKTLLARDSASEVRSALRDLVKYDLCVLLAHSETLGK